MRRGETFGIATALALTCVGMARAEPEFLAPSTLAECAVIFEVVADAAEQIRAEWEITIDVPLLRSAAEALRTEARAAAAKIGAEVAVARVERALEVLPGIWAARFADPLLFSANWGWTYHCNLIAVDRGAIPLN